MWTKRQNSHTSEFPERADLIKGLLQKMLDQTMLNAWIHFELIKEAGCFKNLLSGNAPFLEVALADKDNFELNLGKPKDERVNQITAPGNWKSEKNGLFRVPVTELPQLVKWIDGFFLRVRLVKQKNNNSLDGSTDSNYHTPITSFRSSGLALMKSRMSRMHAGSCSTFAIL